MHLNSLFQAECEELQPQISKPEDVVKVKDKVDVSTAQAWLFSDIQIFIAFEAASNMHCLTYNSGGVCLCHFQDVHTCIIAM